MNNLKGLTRALLNTAFQLFEIISIYCDKHETDALSTSSVHGSVYTYPTGFLFVHGFTDYLRFTLKKNRGVRLHTVMLVK
jgi:hypothetical protein